MLVNLPKSHSLKESAEIQQLLPKAHTLATVRLKEERAVHTYRGRGYIRRGGHVPKKF